MTLVEQVWAKVDEDMLALMQPEAHTDFAALKARLRAFAEVLAIFMTPHFTTADEIAREAKRRYDNRMDPEYCTPGLNQRRYEPPPGTPDLREAYHGGKARSSTPAKRPNATETAISKLSDEKRAEIKMFHDNGFPADVLARTHGVTVAVINAVINA